MTLLDSMEMVEIARIVVLRVERQRQGELDTKSLESSIAGIGKGQINKGIMNPLIVSREDLVLKAGERRLTAAKALGHTHVPVRWAEDLSPEDAQIIELEENLKRQDLAWQDQVRAIARIHGLYKGREPEWTMGETAEAVSLTIGMVSMLLTVHAKLDDPKVAGAGTPKEAWNFIKRKEERAAGDALDDLLGVEPTPLPAPEPEPTVKLISGVDLAKPGSERTVYTLVDTKTGEEKEITEKEAEIFQAKPVPVPALFSGILQGEFVSWAETYTGPKFNFLHIDFPYGVNLFDGPQGRGAEPSDGYKDTEETYWNLISGLCKNLKRISSSSMHMMFWLSADADIISRTKAKFAELAPQLSFHKFPMIWVKSDNAGIASDPNHGPRHVYETCLLASSGKRKIARVKADAYSAPTDKRLHPSTKPEAMLRHFFEMLVDEHTIMLDPTCGSGASLRAAESCGARHTLGLELDPDFALAAQKELERSRALARAAKLTKG